MRIWQLDRFRLLAFALVAAASLSGTVLAQTQVVVGTVTELQNAVVAANGAGGNRTILLRDGTYTLTTTLFVNSANVTIAGQSGNRQSVVIQGDAMSATASVKALIRAAGSGFQLRNLTLQRSGNHLLQIAGEQNADGAVVSNVIFRDAWEQMLKVSIDQANYSITGDNGLIENSLFEYTAGIGPQFYIGGIDVHGGKNWIVRGNTFRSIISPSQEVAEFAIHFWNRSENALIERNLIVDCDRGIGFGLDQRGNTGGVIRNNMIYHSANAGQFADVGIYLEQSPNTEVYNNTVFLDHAYPRSIEYRFSGTTNVLVVNNLSNKAVAARDGATGTAGSNIVTAARSWFVDATQGNLHLASSSSAAIDAGRTVAGLSADFDNQARQGMPDVGADEWGAQFRPNAPTNLQVLP